MDLYLIVEQIICDGAQEYYFLAKKIKTVHSALDRIENILTVMLLVTSDMQAGVNCYDKIFLR